MLASPRAPAASKSVRLRRMPTGPASTGAGFSVTDAASGGGSKVKVESVAASGQSLYEPRISRRVRLCRALRRRPLSRCRATGIPTATPNGDATRAPTRSQPQRSRPGKRSPAKAAKKAAPAKGRRSRRSDPPRRRLARRSGEERSGRVPTFRQCLFSPPIVGSPTPARTARRFTSSVLRRFSLFHREQSWGSLGRCTRQQHYPLF
jgi:hypothetical protein